MNHASPYQTPHPLASHEYILTSSERERERARVASRCFGTHSQCPMRGGVKRVRRMEKQRAHVADSEDSTQLPELPTVATAPLLQ
jgi:hypothetical protein